MKRSCVLVAVVCGVLAGGCGLTPAERVAMYRQTLEKAEPMLTEAHARTVQIQQALDDGLAMIVDANYPMDERQRIWQTVQKIRGVLPDAIEYESKLKTWVETTRRQIEDIESAGPVDASGEAQVIGGAAGGILAMLPAPWNSLAAFAAPMAAAVGWLLEFIRRRKVTAAASAIVAGVQAAPADAAGQVKAAIKTVMDVRGIRNEANAVVDKLKAA